MPRATATTLALALACTGCAQPVMESRPADMDARSLAAAETAFAAHSVREDMRAAFLANFAGDGVFVRQGGWILAHPALQARPAPPIVLDWRPVHTEVAASGELGLSTGPWKLVEKAKPGSPAYGQYVSIWRREGDGPWKVVVDLGIANPGPSFWSDPLEALPVSREAHAAGDVREAETRFAQASAAEGLGPAYARFGSPRLRLYREGHDPMVGPEKGSDPSIARKGSDPIIWTVEQSQVARSGDFAYARGHYGVDARPLGYFLRVWRAENGEWRIVMDVVQDAS